MEDLSFFDDMTAIENFIFQNITAAWEAITSNWILMLSFSILVLGSIVAIFRRIKNIH